MTEQKRYYAYLLRCEDGTLYAGYTDNLGARLRAHNAGRGAKYTRSRLPVALAYAERFPSQGEAMRREAQIKQLPRAQKLLLTENWDGAL